MTNNQLICFRANSGEVALIDDIAKRHSRSRSGLINIMIKTLLTIDEKGDLEKFLLQSSTKEGLTK
jgi:hypothetical protein